MQRNHVHEHLQDVVDRMFFLFRSINRSKAELLQCIYIFDSHDLARDFGASSTSAYLVRVAGIAASTAFEYVRVARQVVDFPVLMAAFAEGAIDYSTVRLLLKYLTADNECELVELAKQLGHEQMKKVLAGSEMNHETEKPDYFFRIRELEGGDVEFSGRANAADGAALRAALKIGEMAHYDNQHPDEEAAAPEKRPTRQTVSGFGMPVGRAHLHAFMGLVQVARTTATKPLRSPGAHVNIIIGPDGHAHMPHSPKTPSKTLENLVANALVRLNVADKAGLFLSTGRAQRLATDAQVNALMSMWGHQCAMPGCNHTRFMEIHHMQEWANGGPTDVVNLIPLCSACHSLVTEGYATVERHGHEIRFFFGDGSAYVSQNHSLSARDHSATPHPQRENWGEHDSFADQDDTCVPV